MSPDIENNIDWTAASTPEDERLAASLKAKAVPVPSRTLPTTKRGVMEALLGSNDLAAVDEGGKDPYNSTGRRFGR